MTPVRNKLPLVWQKKKRKKINVSIFHLQISNANDLDVKSVANKLQDAT